MRELNVGEIKEVNGGISDYEGAGAVIAVYGFGAALSVTPIGWAVGAFALGAAGGLAVAQFVADQIPE
ncbi:hypothetical protein J3L16_13145 [Alteromonas sp. 5E99-2]|uniref:hypothetical protein n=1 Tax=Alteromonas sp. 5E99-2 TaxID=2817683 RepID=UPI001A98B64A|nr:hypothetical protein [Alteromonas sp. 5E99-2]MBO1256633.1 hypothetical protein [Alteromonas sp. 5E99-2]